MDYGSSIIPPISKQKIRGRNDLMKSRAPDDIDDPVTDEQVMGIFLCRNCGMDTLHCEAGFAWQDRP